MKKILLLTVLLIYGLCVIAAPVDEGTAQKVAFNFAVKKSGSAILSGCEHLTLVSVGKYSDANKTNIINTYYIFNVAPIGFIIVSADNAVIPILAYSDESSFDVENILPSVEWWLEEYSNQIAYAVDNNLVYSSVMAQWSELITGNVLPSKNTTSVEPFVTTLWNQTKYYNNLCPIDSAALTGNYRVRAGCVALAMAQVMKHFNYPSHGVGSHTYTYQPYGVISADYANTNYQWNMMPDSLTDTSTDEEILAVATFIYNLGVSVEMMYGPTGSGSYVHGGAHTSEGELISTFGYANTEGVYRSSYGSTEWLNIIKGEIDETLPVLYRGQNTSGHAFVFDGYDDDNYFHVNWGWGGLDNGYYVIDDLTPGNHNYNYSQAALIHVYPTGELIVPTKSFNFQSEVGTPSEAQMVDISSAYLTDNINVTSSSTAFQLSADNVTWSNSVTLPSEGSQIYIRYNPTSAAIQTGTLNVATSGLATKTITLIGNACNTIVSDFPWSENFENSSMPEYWHQEYEHGNNSWTFNVSGGVESHPANAASGNKNVRFSSFQHSPYYQTKLVLPPFDFSEFNSPMLNFWYAQCQQPDQTLFNDYLKVYYKTSPDDEWTLLQSYTDECSEWMEEYVILPNPSEEYYIAFEGVCNWGYGVVLDDISILSSPFITVNDVIINDLGWNGDGSISPGEVVSLTFDVENVSDHAVENAVINLTTTNPYITITDDTYNAGNFAVGEIKTLSQIFSFTAAENIPVGDKITFYFETEAGTEVGIQNFHFYPTLCKLSYNGISIDDSDANNNGILEPGETANIAVFIENAGNIAAMNLVGELTSSYGDVTINSLSAVYGTINANASKYALFNVSLSEDANYDDIIPFSLVVSDVFSKIYTINFEYSKTCTMLFQLHDSYGDGWNGAQLAVSFDDGTPTQNMTISSGSSANYTVTSSMGTNVTLTWMSGSWDSECSFTIVYDDGTTIYTSSSLSSGVLYTFEVNCSHTFVVPCEPVSNLDAEVTANSVELYWNAPEETPLYYDIYHNDEFITSVTETSYMESDVAAGIHTYCVMAVYADCNSEGQCVSVFIEPQECLPPINVEAVAISNNSIEITWETPAATNPIYYKVYRDNTLIGDNVADNYFQDADLEDNTEYCYQISCVCQNELESDLSNQTCSTTFVGITDYDNVTVYPNPVHDKLFINSNMIDGLCVIVNMLGQTVMQFNIEAGLTKVDVGNLSNGSYIVIIGNERIKLTKVE